MRQTKRVTIGDKHVWVKPYAVLAEMAEEIKDKRLIFSTLGYDVIPLMLNSCGKMIRLKSIKCRDENGNCLFEAENDRWVWHESWLTNVDPNKYPEQFEKEEKEKEETSMFVSDFSGSEENLSDAEKYFYDILPQLKEIVINAYNKGVENGKNNS